MKSHKVWCVVSLDLIEIPCRLLSKKECYTSEKLVLNGINPPLPCIN